MHKFRFTRRLKAFSTHFIFSAAVFFIVLYFIVFHWYPKPHFTVNGGWQGVRIMLFVGFFSGPFLTLIIFTPLKSFRALLFDITCILIMQISAFTWGVYAVHSQRPVALSLYDGVVYPVLESDLKPQEKKPADFKPLDDNEPPVVYAHPATTGDEQAGAMMYELIEGITEAKLFFLFEPIKNNIDKLFSASLEHSPSPPQQFSHIRAEYLNQHHFHEGDLAFVPFEGRYGTSLLIFNRLGKIIDAIHDPRSPK
jgi:hypothetical protein